MTGTSPRSETEIGADPVLVRMGEGIALNQQGDREAARAHLSALWDDIGPAGDPLHRCGVAHALADTQSDPAEELRWDLCALEAAELITDERAAEAGVAFPVRAFYPSLHLNLGDVYHRLGDTDRARHNLEAGRAATDALGQDGYALMIRGGLDRLAERLDEAPA